MTLKMDWKTFALFVFAFLWTNRDEVAQRYQDIKKGGVQPLSEREQYIKEHVDCDIHEWSNIVYSQVENGVADYERRTEPPRTFSRTTR